MASCELLSVLTILGRFWGWSWDSKIRITFWPLLKPLHETPFALGLPEILLVAHVIFSTLNLPYILYYTILYYTILYYTILYYTILYYTILCYAILYYTILYQPKGNLTPLKGSPQPLRRSPSRASKCLYLYLYLCIYISTYISISISLSISISVSIYLFIC